MTVDILTFGCRLNILESEIMRRRANEAGLDDAILVNTCAVTGEAVRQARQAIRKARREHPDRKLIVTGCAAQTEPETFAEMEEVDRVIGNVEKLGTEAYRDAGRPFGVGGEEKVRVNDIMSVTETVPHMVDGIEGRTRAYVQVQTGCDHRCTFCIIPHGRGNSRSVPAGDVVANVRKLCENGYREVVLTGVDITSWGQDLPGTLRLGNLVSGILKHVPDLARLRLSSIDSIEADPELMRAIAEEERLMPHLHLSLQSGDDMILKRMKRRHLRDDAIRFCDEARRLRPDMVFGANLIAGFPTETDDMFQRSLDLVDVCGLSFLHVFPFSPRKGTPAALMPQIDRAIVRNRARALREKGAGARSAFLAEQAGETRSVLIEKPGVGRTEHFAETIMHGGAPGEIVAAQITGADADRLTAIRIADAA